MVESEVISMFEDEYELDESELEPPKPLSTERRAEIEELYAQMAACLAEING